MSKTSAIVDIGGSSVKVSIANLDAGIFVSHEVLLVPTQEKKHVFVEPEVLINKIFEALNMSAEKLPFDTKVTEIYISTLRQGFCIINGKKEITPIYLNSDTTGDFSRSDIEKYGLEKIYEETGHWFAPQLTLPKLIHLKNKNPDLFEQGSKVLFVHDWVVWKLTGELVTEMTLVSAGQMAFLPERRIHSQLLDFYNLPSDLLAVPQAFGTEISLLSTQTLIQLHRSWDTAVVCVGGGDSHFLHIGAVGNQSGQVVVSAGSSTPISLLSKELGVSRTLKPWKSTSFSPEFYLLEGNLGYPGTFYGWIKRNTERYTETNPLDADAVMHAPTVFGSCNIWNADKWENRPPFSIMGDFSSCTGSELELGLTMDYAFALHNQISEIINDGYDVRKVVITGGGGNQKLLQITRALLNLPVTLISPMATIKNLFCHVENQPIINTDEEFIFEELSDITIEALQARALEHGRLYSMAEGTRKILENV